jgi:hypothetical protein
MERVVHPLFIPKDSDVSRNHERVLLAFGCLCLWVVMSIGKFLRVRISIIGNLHVNYMRLECRGLIMLYNRVT